MAAVDVAKLGNDVMPLAAAATVANNVMPLAADMPLAAADVIKYADKLRPSASLLSPPLSPQTAGTEDASSIVYGPRFVAQVT